MLPDGTIGGNGVGFIAPHLIWDDVSDEGSTIDNIHFSIRNSGGEFRAADFSSARDAASWLEQLPQGGYDILVTVDMTSADGYLFEDEVVSLADASSSPRQSYFAFTHVAVVADEISVPDFKLRRLLAQVCVNLTGAPDGTVVSMNVEHVAQSVALSQKDAFGLYGLPSVLETSVTLPEKGTLMATASGYSRTSVFITVSTVDGRVIPVTIDTPRMELGEKYQIKLDFSDISADIDLHVITISDWEEGWIVNQDQTL